jgi:hypothetical protein
LVTLVNVIQNRSNPKCVMLPKVAKASEALAGVKFTFYTFSLKFWQNCVIFNFLGGIYIAKVLSQKFM